MTDPYAGSTPVEDITDETVSPSTGLDREADALLRDAEARDAGVRPLRRAVRETSPWRGTGVAKGRSARGRRFRLNR